MDKKFLTAEEAITHFGLDGQQLQQLVDDGKLRALADRGAWKYRRDEIEGLIQDGFLSARNPAGDGVQTLSFDSPKLGAGPDDFSFLELDEDALAEGATMIRKSPKDSDSQELVELSEESNPDFYAIDDDDDSVPSKAGSDSSILKLNEESPATADLPIAESLSEFDIVISDSQPKSEPPVVLQADAAIVADSDSDVKVLEDATAGSGIHRADGTDDALAVEDSSITPAEPMSGLSASDSDVRIADSGISLEGADSGLAFESSGILGRDSAIRLHESGVSLRPVDSGISLEADSGLTLESSAVNSGLTLDSAKPDSGLTLDAGDSGIALDAIPDSGIKLEADSGIALGGSDSGITAPPRKSRAQVEDTQPEFDLPADEEFGLDESLDQTAMIGVDDDDDAMETLAPTRKPGGKSPSLSATFDSADEVEDLEIVDDLDAGELDVDAIEDDEEALEDVMEASDDAFSMSEAGELSEEQLSAASISVVKTAAREPAAWGLGAVLPVAACALLLALNSWMLWDGLSTAWNGDTAQGFSNGIIEALGGLI